MHKPLGAVNLGVTYNCTPTICYAVRSPEWHAVFVSIQTQLNAVGGSVGFSALSTDGKIGKQTLAAWNKTVAWLKAQRLGASLTAFETFADLADMAPAALMVLKADLSSALQTNVLKPAVPPMVASTGGGAQPLLPVPEGLINPADQAAHAAATKKPLHPAYYVAAALGAFAAIYAAYRWAAKPLAAAPRALAPAAATPAIAGHRRR